MPAEMDLKTNPRDPKTGAGTFGGGPSPLHNRIDAPPQQCGAPSRVMPQLKVFPAEIDPERQSSCDRHSKQGSKRLNRFRVLHTRFVPQQYPLPFMVTPQACPSPVLMEANLSPPETGTGIGLSFSELLPSRPRVFVPQQ